MSKIAIIGATGHAGSQLLKEALKRGHSVTAIARNAKAKLPAQTGLTAVDLDVLDAAGLQKAVAGHDAVFSAARFSDVPPAAVIGPVKKAGVPRLLVVGGAATLRSPAGQRLLDSPDFPAAYRAEATAGSVFKDALTTEKDLDWTFLSPSAEFVEGERTGTFRLGQDDLLIDAAGRSWISFADFAIALINELEKPAHSRQRFTVGY